MVAFLFIVIAGVIAITQGVRKITVQYAKRVFGRKMYGGQTQYMPLKVNYAGGMPIIFAWALLLFPTTIVGFAFKNSPTTAKIAVLPSLLSQGLQVPQISAQFFGATSLLLIVGVMLDTMRQVETHLIQRHYDGFLRKGRIRGRSFDRASYSRGEAAGQGTLMW